MGTILFPAVRLYYFKRWLIGIKGIAGHIFFIRFRPISGGKLQILQKIGFKFFKLVYMYSLTKYLGFLGN